MFFSNIGEFRFVWFLDTKIHISWHCKAFSYWTCEVIPSSFAWVCFQKRVEVTLALNDKEQYCSLRLSYKRIKGRVSSFCCGFVWSIVRVTMFGHWTIYDAFRCVYHGLGTHLSWLWRTQRNEPIEEGNIAVLMPLRLLAVRTVVIRREFQCTISQRM